MKVELEHGRPWLSLLTVFLAAVVSGVVTGISLATSVDPADLLVTLAFVGTVLVMTGTYMRAIAHGNKELGWLDHLGKLFAVGAAAFAFWGIIGGAAARQEATWLPGLLLWVAYIGGGVLFVCMVLLARKHRASIASWFKKKPQQQKA